MSPNNPYNAIRDMLYNARDALELYEDLPNVQITATFPSTQTIPTRALIRSMELIGEAARRIPPEFRERHPYIPWTRIVNFRNLLIHEYERIDLSEVYKTARDDLPILIPQLEAILADESD